MRNAVPTAPAATGASDVSPAAGPLTWAAARLRLGQANVGFWVAVALVLVAVAPEPVTGGMFSHALAWFVCVAVFAVLQAPFDVLGGYLLPVAHGRRPEGVGRWGVAWASGVLLHSSVWILFGWMALVVSRSAGDAAAVAAATVGALALVALQGDFARFLAQTHPPGARLTAALDAAQIDPGRVRVVETLDTGFAGGWVGPRGMESLLVPARWLEMSSPALHASLVRRGLALSSGSRALGVIGAIAYNTLGACVVLAFVPGAGFATVGGLLVSSAGFTLWAFVGILTLPTLSRLAVTDLDVRTAIVLGEAGSLSAAIETLDGDQEDEGERPPWTEAIFHPVPNRDERARALRRLPIVGTGPTPWRVARMSLFAGWAHFSWLSRAVHCNIGRPELWAVYPGD